MSSERLEKDSKINKYIHTHERKRAHAHTHTHTHTQGMYVHAYVRVNKKMLKILCRKSNNVIWMKTQAFWDVTVCHWITSCPLT
jgi:hypothetical protein